MRRRLAIMRNNFPNTVSDDMNSLFASTARGLEELLKSELETLGAQDLQVVGAAYIIRETIV